MIKRYRIRFATLEPMRFTGHLDLLRTWERSLRRAGLPLAYSAGFHPHAKLQIGAALPLGVTGSAEMIDLWLEQDLLVADLEARLTKVLPPGLEMDRAFALTSGDPEFQEEIEAGDYTVTPVEGAFPEVLGQAIQGLLASTSVPRERRGKAYDLRPLVLALRLIANGEQRLEMRLSLRQNATGRADEVMAALGPEGLPVKVVRDRLIMRAPGGGTIGSDKWAPAGVLTAESSPRLQETS